MKSFRSLFMALVSLSVLAAGSRSFTTDLAASTRVRPTGGQPARVSIQTDVNGLFATVRPDGTLSPRSATVGTAEQFDLHIVGNGLIALKSVANGRFVSARGFGALKADRDSITAAETFRRLGGTGSLVRLRAVTAKAAVCAEKAGYGYLTANKRCPHPWQLLRVQPSQFEPPSITITAPTPGSILLGTTVTFQWKGVGDEYWLNAGTVPGASDIYASSSLGLATEHTVSGLPLNGAPVYVQVRRRLGTLIDNVNVEYTASVRKGLLVITDFSDRGLEDWAGAGMKNVDDVSAQLRSMEQHWAWLSHGLETFRWDIIRIQLPQPAAAGSYPSWWAFRDAVITLAREQVQTSDYDVNGDGVIDVVWSIVSNGEADVPFALGGASRNAGANLFVDGQASGSVTAGATGNFNHEVGHCLGLPDMYGPYTTLNKLTFMADSWALPPQDFSAYERVKLGWLKPHVVQATTIGVWLPSAHEELAAVMIPTGRSPEYFLIEYRNPPATGYGSAGPDYKGLAVYHVLEGSSMGQDPPLVKLEPADGGIVPNQEVDPNDYAYPENLVLLRPMVLRSYYNDRDEVFRIENVVWRDGGLAFDLVMAAPLPRTNLLTNASFETGWPPDRPDGWSPESFGTTGVTFVWPSPLAAHGESSALLASSGYDAWWRQTVTGLTSGQPYLLCGALKGEAIQDMDGHIGAHVSLLDGFVRSEGLFGTFGWTNSCVRFTAQTSQVDVACRLGRFGSGVSGKLWCDDFTLEYALLGSAFLP